MNTSPLLIRLPLTLALSLVAFQAGAQESRWTLRGFAHGIDSAGDRVTIAPPSVGETAQLATSGGGGLGLEVEYRLRPRLGIELSALIGDLDTELTIQGAMDLRSGEDFDFEMLTVGANYHFTPGRRADFYAGALVAISYGGDIVYGFDGSDRVHTLRFDDDFGLGFRAGVDVPVRRDGPWIVSAGVRYVSAILEGEGTGRDLDLDPLIVSVGIGYRF